MYDCNYSRIRNSSLLHADFILLIATNRLCFIDGVQETSALPTQSPAGGTTA
jgi:hypothetical protein